MERDIEWEDFGSRESGENNSLDSVWGGDVEPWKPVGRGLQDSSIQNLKKDVPTPPVIVEDIEGWVEVSREKTRQTLTRWFIGLCIAWLLIGFVIFLVCGNVWFLMGFGALTVPLMKILDYYFRILNTVQH